MTESPTNLNNRIETLDVLRGFAVLGILLLNILMFGQVSFYYLNPSVIEGTLTDWIIWALIDISAEGAMRALFSILFGAGVLLFTKNKPASFHFKRSLWLLCFGIVDAYFLLWFGDILILYALISFVLYFFKELKPQTLLIISIVLLAFNSLISFGTVKLLHEIKDIDQKNTIFNLKISEDKKKDLIELRDLVYGVFNPTPDDIRKELNQRKESYISAFIWNMHEKNLAIKSYIFSSFWDVLSVMILGMSLFKYRILQGGLSSLFYLRLTIVGFLVGFSVNSFEVWSAFDSNNSIFASRITSLTYDVGRLGMAFSYLGLIILIIKFDKALKFRYHLSNVGKMALTNYLLQSIFGLILFSGAGFSLVGELSRSQLYIVVFCIWIYQLSFSSWWMSRYNFGPFEWIWRGLTYSKFPKLIKAK
jgi:uncharacterized protein